VKLLILAMSLLFSQGAFAGVIEVNTAEAKVYYHPTPTLDLNLIDLEGQGGVLMVFLNYESSVIQQEAQDLQKKYPGYQLQSVIAESANSSFTFSIPEAGIRQDLQLRQGQIGPYLNAEISISREQVLKFKTQNGRPASLSQIEISAQASFTSQRLVEQYKSNSHLCSQLGFSSVKDLVLGLASMIKPEDMQYAQTFSAYKAQILEQCFDLAAAGSAVNSYKGLLNFPIKAKAASGSISATYLEKQEQRKGISIQPNIKIEMN
jgi:hypothetical protein